MLLRRKGFYYGWVVVLAIGLALLPHIQNLIHLYLVFAFMSIGLTLGAGPTLTKIVSVWFYSHRGVTLGIINGGGSMGSLVLVAVARVLVRSIREGGGAPLEALAAAR